MMRIQFTALPVLRPQPFNPARRILSTAADAVHFSGQSLYPGFANRDVAWMRNDMKKCRYAKNLEELIASPLFKVRYDGETVTLSNMRLPAVETPAGYVGVCDDLPRHMLRRLQKRFGTDKYVFEIRGANDDKVFYPGWEHYVILAWPKRRDTEIRAALAARPTEFPPGVLLIDPSLQAFGMPGQDLHHYTLNGDTADRIVPDDTLRFRNRNRTGGTSLGKLGDVDPTYQGRFKDDVLILAFEREDARSVPRVYFKLQDAADQQTYRWSDWDETLAPVSPVRRLAEKIRADLAEWTPTS